MKPLLREVPAVVAPPVALANPDMVPAIPEYLQKYYWWAYLSPRAVRFFEREWLINLILWGNYASLCDSLLAELAAARDQRVLQIACVYGDLSQRLLSRLGDGGQLDVIDVAPVQLANLRRKRPPDPRLRLHQQDASALAFPEAGFDSTVLFFLLHEQPADVRAATLAEALRVTRPGGKIIIVDYHQPRPGNPLRYVMKIVLQLLEPFALDLWRQEITSWLSAGKLPVSVEKTTLYGDLYQKLVIRK